MKYRAKNVFAMPSPDGSGQQISYELGDSRKVHLLRNPAQFAEKPPHGAGSFHDPEHHHILMQRIEDHIQNTES